VNQAPFGPRSAAVRQLRRFGPGATVVSQFQNPGVEVNLKPGTRLRSATSLCEIVIVRPPNEDGVLECAGSPMTDSVEDRKQNDDSPQILLGKRYAQTEVGIEVLCVSAGAGPLTFNGVLLEQKTAQALPASD